MSIPTTVPVVEGFNPAASTAGREDSGTPSVHRDAAI